MFVGGDVGDTVTDLSSLEGVYIDELVMSVGADDLEVGSCDGRDRTWDDGVGTLTLGCTKAVGVENRGDGGIIAGVGNRGDDGVGNRGDGGILTGVGNRGDKVGTLTGLIPDTSDLL